MIPWERLAERYSSVTRIDTGAYHAEMDAIDRAALQAQQWERGPMEDVVVIPIRDRETGEILQLGGIRVPVYPVQASDQARLAVALRQRELWLRAAGWVSDPDFDRDLFQRSGRLPNPSRLLSRKSTRPDLFTAADLLRLAVDPPINPGREEQADSILYPIVKQMERHYRPPLPDILSKPILDLRDALRRIIASNRARQKRFNQRGSTKRLESVVERLMELVKRDAPAR